MTRLPGWERSPAFVFDAGRCALSVLDQAHLPFEQRYLQPGSVADCACVIRDMNVRGAPLIGLVAAAGMAFAARADASDGALEAAARLLIASRPTAVNLRWAVEDVQAVMRATPLSARAAAAAARVLALQHSEYACCARIGEHGLGIMRALADTPRVRSRGVLNVLTHCNAGWLATGAWGTALAPVYRAAAAGITVHVWVDETRPRNQGARLTAWELGEGAIAHSIVVDNCAGHLMQRGLVDVCIVGSDRTTRAGDVCNKIGTYQKALAAADNGVPFYVALPCSTIDWTIADGVREIEIEERDASEVLQLEGAGADGVLRSVRHAPHGSGALNVAFDVTPARLVTGLICEHGVFAANAAALAGLRAVAGGAPQRV